MAGWRLVVGGIKTMADPLAFAICTITILFSVLVLSQEVKNMLNEWTSGKAFNEKKDYLTKSHLQNNSQNTL